MAQMAVGEIEASIRTRLGPADLKPPGIELVYPDISRTIDLISIFDGLYKQGVRTFLADGALKGERLRYIRAGLTMLL